MDITDVPKIMRNNLGWTVAPKYLERWIAGPAIRHPMYQAPMEQLNIAWIFNSQQYKNEFNAAWNQRPWTTKNAKELIVQRILKHGQGQIIGARGRGGRLLSQSFVNQTLDKVWTENINWQDHYVQNIPIVAQNFSTIDEQVGAVGSVTFYLLVNGEARPFKPFSYWTAVFEIHITEVGFFVNDQFNFEDSNKYGLHHLPVVNHAASQHLGWWSFNKPYVWAFPSQGPVGGTHMNNTRFRDWRYWNSHGADFLIGTQTHWERLERPDTFQVWFRQDNSYHIN